MSTPRNGENGGVPAGVILINHKGTPVYFNTEAIRVLSYCVRTKNGWEVADVLPSDIRLMLLSLSTCDSVPVVTALTSGRRRYLCRGFALNPAPGAHSERIVALVLERECNRSADITEAAEQFNLTEREQQTVGLLTLGLTSKEIATRMNVSPNTVKTFFRLVMTKMGVNTRAGILGKIARM